MWNVIVYAFLLIISTDVARSKYVYRQQIRGWIKQHKHLATWDEAYRQCRNEGYGVIASPITEELREEMHALIGFKNAVHHTGTSRMFYPSNRAVSIEGTSLEDMPVEDMADGLSCVQQGQCVAMNRDNISLVPCTARLPFICYVKEEVVTNPECGTFDTGYKLNPATGNCYKMHLEYKNWHDSYKLCESEGAYLAVINDKIEAQIGKNVTYPNNYWGMYIGLRDKDGTGDWISVRGERVEQIFDTWRGNRKDANKPCAIITNTADLVWFDCGVLLPFLCEKEPTYMQLPHRKPCDESSLGHVFY